ncbi:MAG: protein kinase domain-containing protein [Fimbriiglobus sp.]
MTLIVAAAVFTHTTPESGRQVYYRKSPGDEPLPGYILLEPLGKGGFGEVWKCEAPGGLHKAIKFICNSAEGSAANSLEVEYEAFQNIKRIRHPFLLTLEQVLLVGDELLMVMELADHVMQDLFHGYTHQGHPGIPREELLGYLADAAEMLDYIGQKHGLQHLDVKPANLFIVSGRVKVGDFGLVRQHDLSSKNVSLDRGLTPRYVAPEVLHGRVDPRSDQYCLALVYQEMLTGVFPYNARSAQQMMLMHASGSPNVSPLPMSDQYIVSKALSKAPTDRFTSCTHFIAELISAATNSETMDQTHETWGPQGRSTGVPPRSPRRTQDFELPPMAPAGAGMDPTALTGRMTQPQNPGLRTPSLTTQARPQISSKPNVPTLGGVRPMGGPTSPRSTPAPRGLQYTSQGSYGQEPVELVSLSSAPPQNQLPRIWSVVPVGLLHNPHGMSDFVAPDANALIASLVASSTADGQIPQIGGKPLRQLDGTWIARFPIRPITGVAKIKLELLKESWKADIEAVSSDEFFIRRHNTGGFWDRMNGKKNGLIIHVKLPTPGVTMGQALLTGSVFGAPDPALTRTAEDLLPEMLQEVQKILGNADDRRKSVRMDVSWNATMYPLSGDGFLGRPLLAQVKDISIGGLCAITQANVETAYVYTIFHEHPSAATWALLTRLTRATPEAMGIRVAGRFRTDLT